MTVGKNIGFDVNPVTHAVFGGEPAGIDFRTDSFDDDPASAIGDGHPLPFPSVDHDGQPQNRAIS